MISFSGLLIWMARRKTILQSSLSTHGFFSSFLEEQRSLATQATTTARHAITTFVRWIPSHTGMAKLTVDGALSRDGAVGAFCRDSHGSYLGASAVVFDGISDPATLESENSCL
jgi:hypothetical protein